MINQLVLLVFRDIFLNLYKQENCQQLVILGPLNHFVCPLNMEPLNDDCQLVDSYKSIKMAPGYQAKQGLESKWILG